jgi:hypothetical protein
MSRQKLHLVIVTALVWFAVPARLDSFSIPYNVYSPYVEQDKASAPSTPFYTQGHNSEENSAIFDALHQEAIHSGKPVIIISRLGTGEYGMRLHQRRLHNAVERFTSSGTRYSRDDTMATIGPRVKGKGRIEVYIEGKLRFVSEIGRGKDMIVDCCESFPEYYPEYRGKRVYKFL